MLCLIDQNGPSEKSCCVLGYILDHDMYLYNFNYVYSGRKRWKLIKPMERLDLLL